jgi:hypothetical protein
MGSVIVEAAARSSPVGMEVNQLLVAMVFYDCLVANYCVAVVTGDVGWRWRF